MVEDPILGSAPLFPEEHPDHDASLRYVIFEDAPGWWDLPAPVIVIRIEPPPADDDLVQTREGWVVFSDAGGIYRLAPG